jgi:HEAT repeat protein
MVRRRAAYALHEMGFAAEPAVAALGRALHDSSYDVRSWAGLALMRLDSAAEGARDDLVEALRVRLSREGEEDDTRFLLIYLVRALGNIGPEAEAAVPHLQQARTIVADDRDISKLVRWAIKRCRGQA